MSGIERPDVKSEYHLNKKTGQRTVIVQPIAFDVDGNEIPVEVSLPQNSSGIMSKKGILGDDADLATGYKIEAATGIKGITIKSIVVGGSNIKYYGVAANNTAFNDPLVNGLRDEFAVGDDITLSFDQTPLPTEILIVSFGATNNAVADAANGSRLAYTLVQE